MDRVDAAISDHADSRAEFFAEAAKNELTRLEESRVREQIAMMEIDKKILAEGQSVNIVVDASASNPETPYAQCELCHDLLSAPEPGVQGPVFCKRCMGIAKGADMQGLAP